jgi:hypothetical protein
VRVNEREGRGADHEHGAADGETARVTTLSSSSAPATMPGSPATAVTGAPAMRMSAFFWVWYPAVKPVAALVTTALTSYQRPRRYSAMRRVISSVAFCAQIFSASALSLASRTWARALSRRDVKSLRTLASISLISVPGDRPDLDGSSAMCIPSLL